MILSIDTTSTVVSVAIHKNGELIAKLNAETERSAAENLTLMIEEVLNKAQSTFQDLAAIAVAKGPGSYTGLRIGVSSAKGLCFGLDLPLISINSLDIIKEAHLDLNADIICAMLDARRMEVYTKIFDLGQNTIIKETCAVIMDHSFLELFPKDAKVVFCGQGFRKCQSILEELPNAYLVEQEQAPLAEHMGFLANEKWLKKDFEDINSFEPYYLKEFMATTPKNKKTTLG